MSKQGIPINSTISSSSDIEKIEAEISTIQSTRCIFTNKGFMYQGSILDPFTRNLSGESSIKSGVGAEIPLFSQSPQNVSIEGREKQVMSDSQSLSKLMKIHYYWPVASVECNKGISCHYLFKGNRKTENDRENINPNRTSDSVLDTKTQLKRCLERKIAGKARQADCIRESDGNKIYDDFKIPAKRAALSLKLRAKEPTEITSSSSVNIEITSSLLAFLQNPTSNAAFPVLHKQLHKNVGLNLPIVLVNKLDSSRQISCEMIPRENIRNCSEMSPTQAVGSSCQMIKEFDIKCKYSNELTGTQFQIPISTIIQLLSGTVITVSKPGCRKERLAIESASNCSQIERPSCSKNVSYDSCEVVTTPKVKKCLYTKLIKIPVDMESGDFDRKATATAARLDMNPSFEIKRNCEIAFPEKNKCNDAIENSASLDKKQKIDVEDFSCEDVQNLCSECQCPPIDGDIFLCCTKCNNKAHSSCLRYSPELSEIFKDDPWQCWKCEGEINFNDLPYNENLCICDLCGKQDYSLFRSPECEILKCPESYRLCTNCFLEYIQFQLEQLAEQKEGTFRGNIENENSEKSAVEVKETYL